MEGNFFELRNEILCFIGDFNTVRSPNERRCRGNVTPNVECDKFKDFISVCSLDELMLNGRKYTWYREDGSAKSRVDSPNDFARNLWKDMGDRKSVV